MTTVKPELADADFAADTRSDETFRDAARSYLQRVRGGDMGSLPAVLGLVVLFIVFGLANERFLSALNLANLVTQAGSICVLAMGLVFVLLLGDIDLSAGVAGGVSACAMALVITNEGWPWWAAVLAGVVCGALIGLVDRTAASQAGHTVVRRHARVLPWPARRYAQAHRRGRIGPGGRSGDPWHHHRQPARDGGLDLRAAGRRRLRRHWSSTGTAARWRRVCTTHRSGSWPRASSASPP